MASMKESLDTLTRDGVHFGFDISVRFAADCSDKSVQTALATISPDKGSTISTQYLYETFIRPGIGESVREVVSPYRANELNEKQAPSWLKSGTISADHAHARNQIVKVYEGTFTSRFSGRDGRGQRAARGASVLRDKAIAKGGRLQAESKR